MSFGAALDAVVQASATLHLLRPHWLWALLALPLLAGLWQLRRRRASVWRQAVDPHLLPHLIDGRIEARRNTALWLGVLGYLLAVLALAGPSWRQIEQPLWQTRTPLVIALDLSSASLAGDLPPSRLAQARAKIASLLEARQGGQVGLVVYAGDAFTVAPLTEDAANVALFLDALHPNVMPVDGQRGDRAIAWAVRLLRQAGFDRGRILLMTGHADADALEAAAAAAAEGYRVSALGLGTAAGAAYRRGDGSIGHAALDGAALRALAGRGGGQYAALQPDRTDLHALGVLDPAAADAATAQDGQGRTWQDDGYWLVLPLMLLALLAFRRQHGAAALVAVCLWLPATSLHAAPEPAPAPAGSSAHLWQRPDQHAHERMQAGAQAYRAGDHERAAQLYRGLDSADGQYNLGNALARAGDYQQAIEAYERALEREPGMPDALANKRAVEAAMKRQPPQGQQPDPGAQPEPGQDGEPQPGEGEGEGDRGQPSPPQQGAPPQQTGPPRDEADPATDADPADAEAQQAADAAQREAMQRALQQEQAQAGQSEQAEPEPPPRPPETAAERESRLANEAWLQRVPDDPGGLLREKFRIEYERRQLRGGPGE
ncbi:VWA domain-containing protein [Lysobacter sp. D1-1-M9]|uniref:VWA domain-containing protein n=1 Tax=Novilysobacter longmucuonensis TaxID=3098603 RepID=UPI002FC9C9ED